MEQRIEKLERQYRRAMKIGGTTAIGILLSIFAVAAFEPWLIRKLAQPSGQPAATEIFDLRAQCAEYAAREGERVNTIGVKLNTYGSFVSHYNWRTNRCYVEHIEGNERDTEVFDAQTRKALVTQLHEDLAGHNCTGIVIQNDGTEVDSYERSIVRLKEIMEEDAVFPWSGAVRGGLQLNPAKCEPPR